jgi:hypothetical protein
MQDEAPPIKAEMMLPDVLRRYPAARRVLDRYGLRGCGGPQGPQESVRWFARLHGVPLEQLLAELNAAARGEAIGPAPERSIADTIYRPYFLAGILTVLTLGCTWGAVNLWMIGQGRRFGAVDYSWILAHGHAMVFGFVGLFILGFAFQAFPRFKHVSLEHPRMAIVALPLMLAGIALQTVGHLLAPRSPYLFLGMLAGLLQVAAVALSGWVLVRTFRTARKPEPYDAFVLSAWLWFLAAAVLNPVIFWLFEGAPTREQFLWRVASFNIPYRDIQLLGTAGIMILGVSLRFLPHAYGLREPSSRWRRLVLWAANGALVCGIAAFVLSALTGNRRWLGAYQLTGLIWLAIALSAPRQYRLFASVHPSERDRGLKFIRAAYSWFIVATALLAVTPAYNLLVYQPAVGGPSPFSHAFFGAYRHALTVGFITMMIVGVSSKVAPTLSGVDVRAAASLWPTFVLLNLGNALRVTTEIATDYLPGAFRIMGVSGFLEVTGLTLWAADVIRCVRVGKSLERTALSAGPASGSWELGPQTKIAEVLERYPESLQVFLRHGFAPLSNPVLRRTMARAVTLEQACRREGVPLETLLAELRKLTSGRQAERELIQISSSEKAHAGG